MELDYPYQLEIGSHLRTVLEWRRDVVEIAASQDRKLQRELIRCCREDVLFFFNGFVDLFEPRLGDDGANEPQVLPFIPWPHQVEAIKYADEWMGKRDIRVNKSRAQGASYLYSMMFLHRWLFQPMFKVNLVSIGMGLGGSGGSNSALTLLNRRTMRKVASFVVPNMLPYLLAEMAIAACWWFKNDLGGPAFLAWEANGPGQEFQKRVLETDFRDFYYRKYADVVTKRARNKPGYWTQKRSELLGPYREALMEGQYVNPDAAALEELRQYSIGPDGEPFHNGENQKDDPTGAKKAHADRVVSDVVGWVAALDFGRVAGGGRSGRR